MPGATLGEKIKPPLQLDRLTETISPRELREALEDFKEGVRDPCCWWASIGQMLRTPIAYFNAPLPTYSPSPRPAGRESARVNGVLMLL